jgi:membrane-associated protease RseP (regulator of RpoE activity)
MRRFLRNTASLIAISALTACASGYREFYQPNPNLPPERVAVIRVAPPTGTPMVERSRPDSAERVMDAYAKRGYIVIGNSMFNSGRAESESSAVQQGVAVGADLVLILNPTYTGSVTSSVPITTPTTTTSYTNATATAYGRGGPVTAYGSGTTTTYGTQTNYIPITVNRSDYGAVYFIKQKFGLGAFFRDLEDSERQRMQTNRGAVARLIVDDTPAFNADILVGDVFIAIDEQPVLNSESLSRMLAERRGKAITLSIVRNGASLKKTVTLNP